MAETFTTCTSCKRSIAASAFDRPSSHGPGCSVRRSLLAKLGAAERAQRKASASKSAATRKARRAVAP